MNGLTFKFLKGGAMERMREMKRALSPNKDKEPELHVDTNSSVGL
jgi:hypothetical protein